MRLKLGVKLVLARLFLRVESVSGDGESVELLAWQLTVSFLSNSTTLPPLSPVAR